MIWQYVAIFVASFALSYLQAKKAQREARKAADAFKGVLVNKESNIDPIPVIYGTRRVGGTRVFVQAEGGEKNQYLYIALVLCEGEIDDITDIRIDDYSIFDERYEGVTETEGGDRKIWRSTQGPQDTVYIEGFYGADSQSASPILLTSTKWTTSHRLQGVAYLGVRLRWDENVFSGMPEITAVVKGKKCRDPRTGAVVWSDNPAVCLYDYLTNRRYGKGLSDSLIDVQSFRDSANFCDQFETTNTTDFRSEQIFRCNFVLDTGDRLFENVQKFLLGMRGFLPYSNGRYELVIDRNQTPVIALGINEIIGGIKITGETKNDRFNRVNVKFANPNAEWQPDQATWPDPGSAEEAQFLAEDGDELLLDEVDMETITSFYAARDFARIFCLRSRNALRCAITVTSEGLNLVPGDVVRINHPSPGWSGSLKLFQVEEMTLNFEGTVDLQLIEYDPSLYAYQTGVVEPEIPDTDLPDPFDIEPPGAITIVESTAIAADGTLLIALDVSWIPSPDSFTSFYEIGWIKSDGDVVFTDTLGYTSANTPNTNYLITNLEDTRYVVGVRAVSTLGAKSDWVYAIANIQGDITAPDTPTNFTAAGGFRQILLTWQNDTAPDLAYTEVLEFVARVDGGDSTWQTIQQVPAPGNSFVRSGLPDGQRRFYALRAWDYVGNSSGFSATRNATTEFIDSDAFDEEVTQLFTNAGLYAPEPYNTLSDAPLLTNDEIGKLIWVIDEGKLYEWTSNGWQPVVPDLADGIGQITTTQIADDAVTTPLLAANAVTAEQILGGTITGDKIVANTITGGLLATAGIITNSAQIEDALITNAKINNLAVSAFKIGDNAVTIPEFSRVFNSNQNNPPSGLALIPRDTEGPYPYQDLHPENYLTTMVLDFDWGADDDQRELDNNGYNAILPPARISAIANTVFQAYIDDNRDRRYNNLTRIIAIEGTSQNTIREVGPAGEVIWRWNIPDYRRVSNFSDLPATPIGLGSDSGYFVNSERQAYVWNGVGWVRNTSFQVGAIIHVIDRTVFGAATGSYFAKWGNANRFVNGSGILDVGAAYQSLQVGSTGQLNCSGYWDTSNGFIQSNSLKFCVLQQKGERDDRLFAPFTSLLLIGTKK